MTNRFNKAAKEAAAQTNGELREELAKLSRLTEDEIAKLLPTREDKESLARLLAVVNAATSENQKVAALRSNIEAFGPVVVRVLKQLMV